MSRFVTTSCFKFIPFQNIAEQHTISPDGYDVGRYDLSTQDLQHCNLAFCRNSMVQTATTGQTSFNGVNYSATVQNITGLLPVGADGVNHGKFPVTQVGHYLMILQGLHLTAS